MAECIRTFPTVTFPASLLLKREEIETGKRTGASIITSVTHASGMATYMFTEAPFDLLYGFRGALHEVDLLSPYEMLLHWSLERITAPISAFGIQRATWTEEASTYRRQRREASETPAYKAGIHYIAAAGVGRILMEDLSQLRGLRHVWCWELRKRVHIPTWSFAKVPRSAFSPEENARLLSVYMRPWTLDPRHASGVNPLLSNLGLCRTVMLEEVPLWLEATRAAASTATTAPAAPIAGVAAKRRRLLRKQPGKAFTTPEPYYSYRLSWDSHLDGYVVSETSRRYITNLLAATQVSKLDEQHDSSEDSEADDWRGLDTKAGNMNLVERILRGIAARSDDDGRRGFGKHAEIIRMGRALWQTSALDAVQRSGIRERFFDDGTFPPVEESKKAFAEAKKESDVRPAPFGGRTSPSRESQRD